MAKQFAVHRHFYGRERVQRGPCAGLLDWAKHKWVRINARPVGLKRATEIADAEPGHAVVTEWGWAEKAYDNGKAPALPDGWLPAGTH